VLYYFWALSLGLHVFSVASGKPDACLLGWPSQHRANHFARLIRDQKAEFAESVDGVGNSRGVTLDLGPLPPSTKKILIW